PPYLLVHYIHMLSSYARHTLDLHSFPTRRSSDLGRDGHERARDQERTGFTGTEASQGRCRMHALIDPSLEVHDIERGQGRAITQDRKSTRLNSSHGSISYAVFCLKKKIKKQDEMP